MKGYEKLVNFTKIDKGFTELADVPFDKPCNDAQLVIKIKVISQFILSFILYKK